MIFVFTRRERQVIDLLFEGLPQRDIGKRIGIQPRTVKRYVGDICRKLDIPTDGPYLPTLRVVYILSHKKGLLTGWPDPF